MSDVGLQPITEESQPETVTTATQEKSLPNGVDEIQKLILASYDRVGEFNLKRLQVEGQECGLPTLDKNKVFTKNQAKLITVGAHTSHGKSAFIWQVAKHISGFAPVIGHSFEMSRDEIEGRYLASYNGWTDERAVRAREDFKTRQLYISNNPSRSLNYILSSVYELSKVVGQPALVVIDYCQQVKPGGEGFNKQRVNEITDISAGLLELSQQLKCNVLIGAQLNNEVLKRAFLTKDEDGRMDYVPIISDIREGSSIAHDSSTVLMIVRPYVFDRSSDKDKAQFYCLKNRGGELWDASLKWDGSKTMFYEESGI